jgi:hypothetical protein
MRRELVVGLMVRATRFEPAVFRVWVVGLKVRAIEFEPWVDRNVSKRATHR